MADNPAPTKSPDALQLRKKPNVGPRLGGRALAIAAGIAVLLMGVLVWNTESRKRQNEDKPRQASTAQDARLRSDPEAADAFNRQVTDAVVIASPEPPALAGSMAPDLAMPVHQPAPPPSTAGTGAAYAVPDLGAAPDFAGGVNLGESEFDRQNRERREARLAQLEQEREARDQEARKASTSVRGWQDAGAGVQVAGGGAVGASQAMPDLSALAAQMGGLGELAGQGQQPNDQAKKQDFLASVEQLAPPILGATRQPPRSPFELKTGHVIAAVLLRGINSDLPGEVTAMVTENVYDSATGRHLLIPAWSKLFGRYNSDVAYGQKRAQVAWTRLIYPDGSTLELGGMQGADLAGYTGLQDQVNNHYGRLIGFSLLSSVMGAGLQLSVPQPTTESGQLTPQQIVAGEVGREMSQLGMEITRRNLNVQPTIVIRPGYKFTVTVNRDVAFAGPYVTR